MNADVSMTGGEATTSLQTPVAPASDGVPAASGDGLSGDASGSNDPPPLPKQPAASGNGHSGGTSGPNPSQPKPDKSHIAGLSLPLDSLIPPAEQQQAPKRSHRGSVGQTKKAKWTKKDWCWAGWNWGANEAYQGYYGADSMGGSSTQNRLQMREVLPRLLQLCLVQRHLSQDHTTERTQCLLLPLMLPPCRWGPPQRQQCPLDQVETQRQACSQLQQCLQLSLRSQQPEQLGNHHIGAFQHRYCLTLQLHRGLQRG